MAQIKISTKVGEIIIDFKDTNDLESQLDKIDLNELQKIITKKIPSTIVSASDLIEEFKDLYRLNSSNNVVLSKIPKKKGDAIKLAVFLSENGLSTNELKIATGISNPKAYMNKKDFVQNGEFATLSTEARKDVMEKIIPMLRKSN